MAIANIVVKDSAAVDHTFIPVADGKNAQWSNGTGAITLRGEETLGYNISRASGNKTADTVRMTVYDPKESTDPLTGLVKVAHGNSSDVRFNFNPNATLVDRKDLVAMTKNWIIAYEAKISALEVQL